MDSFKDIYFPQLDNFTHGKIFQKIEHVWDPLKVLQDIVRNVLNVEDTGDPIESLSELRFDSNNLIEGIVVDKWIKLKNPIISKPLGIRIDTGTTLEPTAIIKGPAIIGKDNDIRQGSYVRGNIMVGNNCVIGHCTEVKNSILMNHVEAGHFNYIGDSIIGSYVNMGAGARLANVQFRSLQEKMKNYINDINIPSESGTISTQMSKFGSIIGDNSEIGCNAVLCPGTLIAKDNWVYPNCTVTKGFHPPGHFIAPSNHKLKSRLK